MPDNGSSVHDWLRHLDQKLDALHAKLDRKADGQRVEKLEDRTRHLEVKQAGIAGVTSAIALWLKSHFFS